ncbi:PstS family phosphate ABC transporter substrate-binding protein [Actinophytocola gossypii]|uniref:Substrate-binding domain-containing protein n=1 Tax=Actinophytocola gossypii TaxID=2812003 RepID=A0ABT2JEZ5_9PSEU|nr:substrate-binding domain-containing protein [Actinophytocola gossypii]MCT2586099.1 substrate-binding domain-containing protein [Actinophytocola gossypii]
MGIGQLLQTISELLLSGEGSLVLGIAAAIGILSPFAQRYLATRKRVYFRVQSDSKIGLDVDLHDGDDGEEHADGRLIAVAELVGRLSFVVIRIRNTGGEVALRDLDEPVEFTFRDRVIWNARISDPSERTHREDLVKHLEFFSTAPESDRPAPPAELPKVRRAMLPRMLEILRPTPVSDAPPPPPQSAPPEWHGVRLKRDLTLAPKEKFKLVVVLREPVTNMKGALTKGVDGPSGRRIKDERTVRRTAWPLVTAGFGVLLAGALVAINLLIPDNAVATDPNVECATGELTIVGSSAFTPTMSGIADQYRAACDEARITVTPTGSISGVRQLNSLEPAERETVAALSDGVVGEATSELERHPVAVIVYTVVVNDSVNVEGLTRAQLRDIYQGRYRDWNELRPGPSLPIRIVGRGQESGSRRTFEQTVLGAAEGALTSDSCERTDRIPDAPTIRCERSTEAQLLDEIAVTPGAIGYADLPTAREAEEAGRAVTVLRLDDREPGVSGISAGYPLWTVEYLYTKRDPTEGSLLDAYLDFLRSSTARAELRTSGFTPCIGKDGQLHLHCHD